MALPAAQVSLKGDAWCCNLVMRAAEAIKRDADTWDEHGNIVSFVLSDNAAVRTVFAPNNQAIQQRGVVCHAHL